MTQMYDDPQKEIDRLNTLIRRYKKQAVGFQRLYDTMWHKSQERTKDAYYRGAASMLLVSIGANLVVVYLLHRYMK